MGAVFNLEHANIMAYLTSQLDAPPRVVRRHLDDFLGMLVEDPLGHIIVERGHETWPAEVADIAKTALSRLRRHQDNPRDHVVPAPIVRQLLAELRPQFDHYPLYALAVGAGDHLRGHALELARMPMNGQLLVLIPDYERGRRNLDVLDPMPAFSIALHAAPEWPGFLFWSQTGEKAFARLNEVFDLARQLVQVGPPPPLLWRASTGPGITRSFVIGVYAGSDDTGGCFI